MTSANILPRLVLSSEFQKAMPEFYNYFCNSPTSLISYVEFFNSHYEYTPYQSREWTQEVRYEAAQMGIYSAPINSQYSISGMHQGISFSQPQGALPANIYCDIYTSIFSNTSSKEDENYDLLIPGLRYIGKNYLIFEMPPTQKVVNYKEAYREDSSVTNHEFYIPVPWQVYIAIFDPDTMRLLSVQMYFSNTPLTSFEQQLYLSPMLNFYSSGMLCRPFFETIEDIEKYPKNITGVFASAYDWVWNSGYNFDIVEPIAEFICSPQFDYFTTLLPDTSQNKILIDALKRVKTPSNRLPPVYVHTFFSLWQQLSLYQVTTLQWTPFSIYSDFFNTPDNEYYDTESFENFLNEYGFTLVEEYDEDHDPDDDYITAEDVLHHPDYRRQVRKKLYSSETTLLDALKVSERFMSDHRISISSFKNSFSFRSFMNKILSKLPCFV